MQYLSLRFIFLCVFLPPVLYIYTLQAGEWIISHRWQSALEQSLIANPQELLHGRETLEDHISQRIHAFLQDKWLIELGAKPRIWVRTQDGHYLYPDYSSMSNWEQDTDQGKSFLYGEQSSQVAAQNLKLLQKGLVVGLSVHIDRNSWLANIVLIVYILFFSSLLIAVYIKRARETDEKDRQYREELESARQEIRTAHAHLQELKAKEQSYARDVENLKQELDRKGQELQGTEEEALAELMELEAKLQESEEQRKAKEELIAELQREADRLQVTTSKQNENKQRKGSQHIAKRLCAVYKNLKFDSRAIDGFVDLSEMMQIRAEECLSTLSHDHQSITVKRKVFTKKGNTSVFETEFAYKGRLYWRPEDTGKIRVVTIGTKNTQNKDLKYIESL